MDHPKRKTKDTARAIRSGKPKSTITMSGVQEDSQGSSLPKRQSNSKADSQSARKRKKAQKHDPANNSASQPPTSQRPLSPTHSNETPGPSKAVKKDQSIKPKADFFDHKKDIARTKHGVLSNYLAAWFAILSYNKCRFYWPFSYDNPQYSRLVYVDGFAGPGRYKENDDTGSPLVAYGLALKHERLPENGPEIDMIFIEMDKTKSEDLFKNLTQAKLENLEAKNVLKVKFMVINAEFAKGMDWILSNNFTFNEDGFLELQSVSLEIAEPLSQSPRFITEHTPLFVFVDPFGYNGQRIPMTLMQKIVRTTTKAEILINLMTGFLQRFLTLDSHARAINLLIGQEECDGTWKPIVLQDLNAKGIEKMNLFLDHYSDKISEQAETFVAIFEMRNNRNCLLYNLFFVCQHEKAFFKMKESMRKCSQSDVDLRYSSFKAKDPNFTRETLEIENLVQDIIQHFKVVEFQGRDILGSEITQFINDDAVLYQRYKTKLTKHLDVFRTNKIKGVRQKFDEMKFNFFLSDNVSLTED